MPEDDDTPKPRTYITNSQLALEIKSLRSDFKLWVFGAVALNQFLSGMQLPSAVTAGALIAVLVKPALALLLRS